MKNLPLLDISIIVFYLISMIAVGFFFSLKSKSSEQYTKASGSIPGWAIGLSLYATFLSSNTFLGVPGKAFGGNWNAFVFSISMPIAAIIAAKLFVPFYRKTQEISAYTHLEHRFGAWARTYAVCCFLLTQLARMGSIFFGIALSLQALTGYDMQSIMIVVGICIVVYTVLGGIEAVIWTEVVQAVLLTFGAITILVILISKMPGGVGQIIDIGLQNNKFSLGSFSPDFTTSTFWVILLYGFFINLNNFGIDQNYIQRYHTAKTQKEASKSLWVCVGMYVPVSLLFFVIGSCLFAYYQVHPQMLDVVKLQAAAERFPLESQNNLSAIAQNLKPSDYGDKVMPKFMVQQVPTGLVGLIISAIMSAAMSTISSGMNSSATVFSIDIYKRYFKPDLKEKNFIKLLHIATAVFGIGGMAVGISLIGTKSVLDVWWELSGIFAGGMLGLFLLGIISRQTKNHTAIVATTIGVLVILWLSLSGKLSGEYAYLKSPFDSNMVIVIGTLSLFLSGVIITKIKKSLNSSPINS
ncbi:sodium:solute symporter [Pedobacter alpinus]|uniref:Sodium:solute symporter n=1 Tax=Pedobacter alpinus TaxID=1590643 RepID=A0ABW5TMN7_9SPHI